MDLYKNLIFCKKKHKSKNLIDESQSLEKAAKELREILAEPVIVKPVAVKPTVTKLNWDFS
ncbi:MAG: hypothetical protein ACR2HS_05190 [Gammaproteobacteria bacterium]